MSRHRQWTFRIRHLIEAIEKIETYTAKLSLPEFIANQLVRQAVERNFEIIGEAAKYIPAEFQKKNSGVPWEKMQSMRNFIIHQYDEVEEIALWNTIQRDLPKLKIQLQALVLPVEEP